jgi:membrane protein DedA with SNARE-associated domain
MSFLSHSGVDHLITTYGYWALAAIIALESMAVPLPGETALIVAALIAATTDVLNIWVVIAVAAFGAIVGDIIGFWIGREVGFRWLIKYGRYLRITEPRIKLGQYLFLRHGGKVVFFGRFIAVLRVLAAFLAGANSMRWAPFLLANATGGIVWASSFGFGAYYLGKEMTQVAGPAEVGIGIAAGVIVITAIIFVRRHEAELQARAERALPGPIIHPHTVRYTKPTPDRFKDFWPD